MSIKSAIPLLTVLIVAITVSCTKTDRTTGQSAQSVRVTTSYEKIAGTYLCDVDSKQTITFKADQTFEGTEVHGSAYRPIRGTYIIQGEKMDLKSPNYPDMPLPGQIVDSDHLLLADWGTYIRKEHYKPLVIAPPTVTPEQEALRQGQTLFEKFYTHCGDSYYLHSVWYVQLKDVTFSAISDPLSEVDRMNGVEWRGRVHVVYRFYREYRVDHWTDYASGNAIDLLGRKVKGRWEWDNSFAFSHQGERKPTCSEIAPG